MDDVVDLDRLVLDALVSLLGRGVGPNVCDANLAPARSPPLLAGVRTDFDTTLGDHGAVGLIDNVVDELQIVRVRDDLVVGDDVLRCGVSAAGPD